MKISTQLLFFVILATSSSAQSETSYGMTDKDNWNWIRQVQNSDAENKWILVGERLIKKRRPLIGEDGLHAPLLVIDGIPIKDLDQKQIDFLKKSLTGSTVDIQATEKEPEGLTVDKPFAGVVLVRIKDKKRSKEFRELN